MKINDTRNWQMSILDPLVIVEGGDDIAQCVDTILSTVPGSDPLRPDFGSNVYQYIDKPINEVRPSLIYDVITSIGRWEKRLAVNKCTITDNGIDGRILNIDGVVVASGAQVKLTTKI